MIRCLQIESIKIDFLYQIEEEEKKNSYHFEAIFGIFILLFVIVKLR